MASQNTESTHSFWSLLQILLGFLDYWSQNSHVFLNTKQCICQVCFLKHRKIYSSFNNLVIQDILESKLLKYKLTQSSPISERINSECNSKKDLGIILFINNIFFLFCCYFKIDFYNIVQAGLKLMLIHLPQPLKCWDYRVRLSHLTDSNNCWLKINSSLGAVAHKLGRRRLGDQELKAILCYAASSRLTWTTWDAIL